MVKTNIAVFNPTAAETDFKQGSYQTGVKQKHEYIIISLT
jgi:hypothetical protein